MVIKVSKKVSLTGTRKIRYIIKALESAYGIPRPDPDKVDPLDELILTILSQNTNDLNRDRAFRNLRERFPAWKDVAQAKTSSIEAAIRVGGLAEQKSRRIKAALGWVKRRFGDYSLEGLKGLPSHEVYNMLTSLEGVGPKTASIVLLFSLGRPFFPVDTHIHRVTTRLGLLPERTDASRAHEILKEVFPEEKYYSIHLNIIAHGRKICVARNPKCSLCVLRQLCPWPEKHKKMMNAE